MTRCAIVALAALLATAPSASQGTRPAPAAQEATRAILQAFATHDLVAMSDAHGDARAQDFLRHLIQQPGFADIVNDIVVEFGNARYQAIADQYVRGDDVPLSALQPGWQNVVTPNQIWADEAFFEVVRRVNAGRAPDRRLRVLMADPPIDWAAVRSREDHFQWLVMRDSFPAALIQVEVLAKRRKALIVYGHLHFQRRQIQSNFDMSDWRMQTIVSLIERSSPQRVFTIWRLGGELTDLVPESATFAGPTLLPTRNTSVGAADVARLSPAWTKAGRFAVRNGQLAPVPPAEWQSLAIEEQLDAVLYLGPLASARQASVPPRACAEPGFLQERLRRIALTGIPSLEADRVRQVCNAKSP